MGIVVCAFRWERPPACSSARCAPHAHSPLHLARVIHPSTCVLHSLTCTPDDSPARTPMHSHNARSLSLSPACELIRPSPHPPAHLSCACAPTDSPSRPFPHDRVQVGIRTSHTEHVLCVPISGSLLALFLHLSTRPVVANLPMCPPACICTHLPLNPARSPPSHSPAHPIHSHAH